MNNGKSQQVRIIGGRWRSRQIHVADIEGLRPTTSRVRETLFNWVALDCPGAHVLDCFTGSGALGFEALSREAKQVTMLEKNIQAYKSLMLQADRLAGDSIEMGQSDMGQSDIRMGDALKLIPYLTLKYDLVFIDPPFAEGHLKLAVLEALVQSDRLNHGAKIYLEWPKYEPFELPSNYFGWLKHKKAGQVNYAMVEWLGSR
jgi:16S rRNA (guanine966-N2)-methyltransferase